MRISIAIGVALAFFEVHDLQAQVFTDVAVELGVADDSSARGSAWGDYDNDGNLDLYVTNGGTADRLYRQATVGGFTDVAATSGIMDAPFAWTAVWETTTTMGISICQ